MKVKYIPVFALIGLLAILSGMPALSSGITYYAYARYATNTQTMANNNECDNGANCANPAPQSIGDGTANSPVNTQISNFNEEQEDGVGGTESCIVSGLCVLTVQPCTRQAFPDIVCFVIQPESGRIFCNLAGLCDIYFPSNIGRSFQCEPAPVPSTEIQVTTCTQRIS